MLHTRFYSDFIQTDSDSKLLSDNVLTYATDDDKFVASVLAVQRERLGSWNVTIIIQDISACMMLPDVITNLENDLLSFVLGRDSSITSLFIVSGSVKGNTTCPDQHRLLQVRDDNRRSAQLEASIIMLIGFHSAPQTADVLEIKQYPGVVSLSPLSTSALISSNVKGTPTVDGAAATTANIRIVTICSAVGSLVACCLCFLAGRRLRQLPAHKSSMEVPDVIEMPSADLTFRPSSTRPTNSSLFPIIIAVDRMIEANSSTQYRFADSDTSTVFYDSQVSNISLVNTGLESQQD